MISKQFNDTTRDLRFEGWLEETYSGWVDAGYLTRDESRRIFDIERELDAEEQGVEDASRRDRLALEKARLQLKATELTAAEQDELFSYKNERDPSSDGNIQGQVRKFILGIKKHDPERAQRCSRAVEETGVLSKNALSDDDLRRLCEALNVGKETYQIRTPDGRTARWVTTGNKGVPLGVNIKSP